MSSRPCSLTHLPLSMMPAESSEIEYQRLAKAVCKWPQSTFMLFIQRNALLSSGLLEAFLFGGGRGQPPGNPAPYVLATKNYY